MCGTAGKTVEFRLVLLAGGGRGRGGGDLRRWRARSKPSNFPRLFTVKIPFSRVRRLVQSKEIGKSKNRGKGSGIGFYFSIVKWNFCFLFALRDRDHHTRRRRGRRSFRIAVFPRSEKPGPKSPVMNSAFYVTYRLNEIFPRRLIFILDVLVDLHKTPDSLVSGVSFVDGPPPPRPGPHLVSRDAVSNTPAG